MPVTASLGDLPAPELASLLASVDVVLKFPHLYDTVTFTKLDTLSADLTAETEDRERIAAARET